MFPESDTSFIRWSVEASLLPERERERVILILTASYVELLINCLAKENAINEADSLQKKIDKIHVSGLIGAELKDLLHWFRKLRNKAAHEPFFRLKPEDVQHLPSYWSNPEHFEHVCKGICGSLWNEHSAIFSKAFGVQPRA